MFDGGGAGFALLLVGGTLFLRGPDLLFASRIAGRLCGSGLHLLRTARVALDETLAQESAPGVVKDIKDGVYKSLQQIDDISRTMRREVVENSPAARLRAATGLTRSTKVSIAPRGTDIATKMRVRTDDKHTAAQANDIPQGVAGANGQMASGASVVSRVIEEAALAERRARFFPKASDSHRSVKR